MEFSDPIIREKHKRIIRLFQECGLSISCVLCDEEFTVHQFIKHFRDTGRSCFEGAKGILDVSTEEILNSPGKGRKKKKGVNNISINESVRINGVGSRKSNSPKRVKQQSLENPIN